MRAAGCGGKTGLLTPFSEVIFQRRSEAETHRKLRFFMRCGYPDQDESEGSHCYFHVESIVRVIRRLTRQCVPEKDLMLPDC